MVFYRKYRPQIIDDLDSEKVRESLLSVLKNQENTPHAFLFTGPKGLGKTSTARIVAKVLNCTDKKRKGESVKGREIEPCNKCDQCLSITEGTNMDILEIDGASNRGIDEIRDLKEKIGLSPISASKKVYIIDEVHMLTTEAFNALLKTLEEPPNHAIFILCTTALEKVPSTIVSRCFHISFHLATDMELIRSFKRITKGERVAIDDEALLSIAHLSDGGFRDGTKILEEIVMQSNGKKITGEMIEEKYRVTSINHYVIALLASLYKKDSGEGMKTISKLTETGIDFRYFLQQVIETLHKLLLSKTNATQEVFEIPGANFEIAEIALLFDILSKSYQEMKYSVLPQLPLELAVIEYSIKTREATAENLEVDKGVEGVKSQSKYGTGNIGDFKKKIGNIAKENAINGSISKKATNTEKVNTKPSIELMHTSSSEITPEWLDTLWNSLIDEMKNHNHTIAGVLRGCRLKSYDKKMLLIESKFKFHKERLDDVKVQESLSRAAKMLTGNSVDIVVELK